MWSRMKGLSIDEAPERREPFRPLPVARTSLAVSSTLVQSRAWWLAGTGTGTTRGLQNRQREPRRGKRPASSNKPAAAAREEPRVMTEPHRWLIRACEFDCYRGWDARELTRVIHSPDGKRNERDGTLLFSLSRCLSFQAGRFERSHRYTINDKLSVLLHSSFFD